MMNRYLFRLAVSLCIAPLAGIAQESIHYGSVAGRVTDISGAVIAGATVKVQQLETGLKTSAMSDRDGRFRVANLRLGPYEISVAHDGFSQYNQRLTVTIGSAFDLPVALSIAGVRDSVVVTEQGPVLETARSQIAETVSRAEFQSLPMNGRNFVDIALLAPGVSPTNTASTQLFPETSGVAGQGISVSSQRNFSNNFIVDGLSANDDAAGLVGTSLGVDALQEFQVVISGGQAEFGRALGGYVNVVTKSGTNALHGDLYGYFRHNSLNARNALADSKLPLTQAQFGASVGGPLLRDRTFYFVNFEQGSLNQSGLVTITPVNVAAINARLVAVAYPGPLVTTGQYSNPVHNSNVLAKLDHQFNSRDQFSIRYSLYRVDSKYSRGAGALNAPSAAADLNDTDHTIAAGNVWTISSKMVNETRGQFMNSDLAAPPDDLIGPSVSISGVASFGRLAGSPTARLNRLYQLVDNLSYQTGSHALRVGTDFLYNDTTITYPRQLRGSYSFSSLSNFLSGVYNNSGFTQTFGNSTVSQSNPNIGIYAQDEWKMSQRLTLNFGLRYELQFLERIATDTNNVSPRAGFAWTPFHSRRTVIRGGFGIFYDRVPLRALANALLSSNNTTEATPTSQLSVSLTPTQTGAPVFPNIISALPSGMLFNYTTMNPNMQNAYSTQGNVEIEHQFGEKSRVSIGYQHLRGIHLIASINQNAPTCVASGNNNGCRPNPNYANNSQYSPAADSIYDGLHISFVQRPTRWGTYRISYSYSKSMNNVGEFFFSSPIDPSNIWRDWGRSDDDQRHCVVFNGTIHTSMAPSKSAWQKIHHGFQLSGTLQYYSALPFNITTGANTIQGTTARPIANGDFIPRNSGTGFDLVNANIRITRAFALAEHVRMEAIAEAFNALNHVNGVTLNGVFGTGAYPSLPSSTFMRTTSVADPRSLQLALRLNF